MEPLFIRDSFLQLLSGVPLTLELTAFAFVIGLVLATLIALMQVSGLSVLRIPVSAYVFVIRGTPLLVQIFLIYYGLSQFRPTLQSLGLWQFFREAYWCGILALSLNSAAYGSEVIRGGLQSVSRREIEAARACGMSGFLLYRRIILPLALRQALPAYGNELILMVKATSLVSIITMMEVTGIAARLISETYRPVEVFIAAGTIYLIINFLLTRAVSTLDWWLTPHLRSSPNAGKLEHAND
ncbi:ABC transporter permease subunit [Agrobacterium sp. ICMP 6402]|uniref:ABC transporter permease n=1 Tax=Agrobacterium sp. ICMP 6402 TaxID=2292443 RepID=UPI0012979AE1|nr:ABC transporter permease [Agrobacterium sp. ICMP 6402]MQB12440.1 ABC transporter permease subunit [Agrobacterium sp. ICMP 6402]